MNHVGLKDLKRFNSLFIQSSLLNSNMCWCHLGAQNHSIGMGGYEKAYTSFKEFATWNCHPKGELMKLKAIPPKPALMYHPQIKFQKQLSLNDELYSFSKFTCYLDCNYFLKCIFHISIIISCTSRCVLPCL